MNQTPSAPALGTTHAHYNTPNAWYEASSSLSGARAVASVLADSLPVTRIDPFLQSQVSHLEGLIGALSICLDACARDLERLEQHLNTSEGFEA